MGLVEAQRISVERKDGIEIAFQEGDGTDAFIDNLLVKEKSLDVADQLLLARTKTGRSEASVEAEKPTFANAGIVPETHYSNFQLVKKVCPIMKGN
jgi:hypothetical protein